MGKVLLGVGLFLLSFAISVLAVVVVIIKIPADYFSSQYPTEPMPGKPRLRRWSALILKNLLGVILILIGIVLSLPGIPGQGILTILIGLILLDIPGKRPVEVRIIRRPSILKTVNNLRAKFNKFPLIMDLNGVIQYI